MERWSTQQRAAIVELYFASNYSVSTAQRKFRARFGGRACPRKSILRYAESQRNRGRAIDAKRPGRRRAVRNEETVERVRAAITNSPKKSARRLSQEIGVNRETVRNILQKELNLLSYKLQVSHKLKPADFQSRFALCNTMIGLNLANRNFGEKLIMTADESLCQ
jgi:transposase-like protein